MTLDDAKVLLTDNNIPFDLVEYENEKDSCSAIVPSDGLHLRCL